MLSTPLLCRRSGITYRQADYWCRLGVLRCIDSPTPGSGAQRRFTSDEVFVARAVLDLTGLGMSLDVAAVVAEQLRRLDDRTGLMFVDEHGRFSREPTGGSCYVMDLDDLAHGIDALAAR